MVAVRAATRVSTREVAVDVNEETNPCKKVVWAAGVQACPASARSDTVTADRTAGRLGQSPFVGRRRGSTGWACEMLLVSRLPYGT